MVSRIDVNLIIIEENDLFPRPEDLKDMFVDFFSGLDLMQLIAAELVVKTIVEATSREDLFDHAIHTV